MPSFFRATTGGERIQRQFRGHCRHVTTPILLPFFSFCNIFQLPRARREGAGAFPLPANRNLRQEVTCKGESCPVFTSTHQTLRIFVRCLQSQRWGLLQRRLFFRNISWQFPVPYILLLSGVLLLPCLLFPRRIHPPPSLRSAVVEAPTIIVIMLSSSFSLPPFLLGQGREGDPSFQQQQLATTTHPLPPSPQPTSAAPSRGGLDGTTTTFPLPLTLSHFFPLSPSPKRRDRRRGTRGCRPVVSLLP